MDNNSGLQHGQNAGYRQPSMVFLAQPPASQMLIRMQQTPGIVTWPVPQFAAAQLGPHPQYPSVQMLPPYRADGAVVPQQQQPASTMMTSVAPPSFIAAVQHSLQSAAGQHKARSAAPAVTPHASTPTEQAQLPAQGVVGQAAAAAAGQAHTHLSQFSTAAPQSKPKSRAMSPSSNQALLQQVQAALLPTSQTKVDSKQQQTQLTQQQVPRADNVHQAAAAVQAQPPYVSGKASQQQPKLMLTQEQVIQMIQLQAKQQQQQRMMAAGQQPLTPASTAGTQQQASQQQLLHRVLASAGADAGPGAAGRRTPTPPPPQPTPAAAAAAGAVRAVPAGAPAAANARPYPDQLLKRQKGPAGSRRATGGSNAAAAADVRAGTSPDTTDALANGSSTYADRRKEQKQHLPPVSAPVQQPGSWTLTHPHAAQAAAAAAAAAPQQRAVDRVVDVENKQQQQQQQQQEGQEVMSQEVLTLLTMIAATAVYGAAESTAAGRLPPLEVNTRLLCAAKRFLSALVCIDEAPSAAGNSDGNAAVEHTISAAAAAAAAAPAAPAQQPQVDAAAEAAAAALCSLPLEAPGLERSSSGGVGPLRRSGLCEEELDGSELGYQVGGYSSRAAAAAAAAAAQPHSGRKRGRPRKADALVAAFKGLDTNRTAGGAWGRPPPGGRGGRGGRRRHGSGGGRSNLIALLQAVEEQEMHSSGAQGTQRSWGSDWGAAMDWTAATEAEADADPDVSDEEAMEQVGRGGRPRRAAAKRPRYMEVSSSVDVRSPSYSMDSSNHRRRFAAAGSDNSEEDDENDLTHKRRSSKPGSAYGRHTPHRATEDSYQTASAPGGRAAAAAAAAGGGGGGQRGRGVRQQSPAVQQKKHRWIAGANQWVTEDGLTVWPKDTLVTPEQRVFYVAFKWVQQHWPEHVEAGEHVSDVPVSVYLDGEEVAAGVSFMAKIRVYNTAAHLVITPYNKLAGLFAGKYVAGYAHNHHTDSVRVYLSRHKPKLEPPAGVLPLQPVPAADKDVAGGPDASPGAPAAAAAAAAGGFTPTGSVFQAAETTGEPALPLDRQQQEQQLLLQQQQLGPSGSAGGPNKATKVAAGRAAASKRWDKHRALRAQLGQAPHAAPGSSAAMAGEGGQMQGHAAAAAAAAPAGSERGAAAGRTWALMPTAAAAAGGGGPAEALAEGAAAAAGAGDIGVQQHGSSTSGVAAGHAQSLAWDELQQQLELLQGLDVAVDAGELNNAVLSVSDALQLPDALLAGVQHQLMLCVGAAAAAAAAAPGNKAGEQPASPAAAVAAEDAAAAVCGDASGQQQQQPAGGVRDALKGWLQQLRAAVAACDGSRVAQLVQELGAGGVLVSPGQ